MTDFNSILYSNFKKGIPVKLKKGIRLADRRTCRISISFENIKV